MTTLRTAAISIVTILALGCGDPNSKSDRYADAVAILAKTSREKSSEGWPEAPHLPSGYEDLSVDGRVYITQLDNSNLYLFPIFYGKASNFHGVLYSPSEKLAIGRELQLTAELPGKIGKRSATVTDMISDELYAVSTDFLD